MGLAVWRSGRGASFAAVVLATTTSIALAQGVRAWKIAEAVGLFTVAVASDRRTVVRPFAVSTLVLVVALVLTVTNQGPRLMVEAASEQLTLTNRLDGLSLTHQTTTRVESGRLHGCGISSHVRGPQTPSG
jgi:hypothetical protein